MVLVALTDPVNQLNCPGPKWSWWQPLPYAAPVLCNAYVRHALQCLRGSNARVLNHFALPASASCCCGQVTVIPVVAKADTMTDEELATFRQEVSGCYLGVISNGSSACTGCCTGGSAAALVPLARPGLTRGLASCCLCDSCSYACCDSVHSKTLAPLDFNKLITY